MQIVFAIVSCAFMGSILFGFCRYFKVDDELDLVIQGLFCIFVLIPVVWRYSLKVHDRMFKMSFLSVDDNDAEYYEQSAKELHDNRNPSLWIKACSWTDNNNDKAECLYIKMLVLRKHQEANIKSSGTMLNKTNKIMKAIAVPALKLVGGLVCLWLFRHPLIQIAAENGIAKAQYALSRSYAEGDGVQKNDAEAFKWCIQAAKQGNADAEFMAYCSLLSRVWCRF